MEKLRFLPKNTEKTFGVLKSPKNGPNDPKFCQNNILAILQLFYRTEFLYLNFVSDFLAEMSQMWAKIHIFLQFLTKKNPFFFRQKYQNSVLKKVSKTYFTQYISTEFSYFCLFLRIRAFFGQKSPKMSKKVQFSDILAKK